MLMKHRLLRLAAASLCTFLPVQIVQAQGQATTFTVLVENVSTEETLRLPDRTTSRVPVAPGAYAIVSDGVHPIHDGNRASQGLEKLAEDGMPEEFVRELKRMKGVRRAGTFLHDEPFTVTVRPGERLVMAAMFAQSNDLFYATEQAGISLFDEADRPVSGGVAGAVRLLDAGTEVNEAPGAGPNQAPRQPSPGAGQREDAAIGPVMDGFTYPVSDQVLTVTVTPADGL